VFDTEGKPLRNTLVEIWQANAAGATAPMGSLAGAA
jgi:protocatechuate 3,4-dioxygenase beta subunit